MAGTAWATLAAQCVGALLFLTALRKEVGWYGLPTNDVMGSFGRLAVPLVARCVLGMGVYVWLARSAATAGVMAMAGHQVAMQVSGGRGASVYACMHGDVTRTRLLLSGILDAQLLP